MREANYFLRIVMKSWDTLTGQHVLNYVTDGDAYANSMGGENISIINLAWSPDGTKLAVASTVKIYLFDAKTAQILHSWPLPSGNAASPFSALSASHGMTPLSSKISLPGTYAAFWNVAWSPASPGWVMSHVVLLPSQAGQGTFVLDTTRVKSGELATEVAARQLRAVVALLVARGLCPIILGDRWYACAPFLARMADVDARCLLR